MLRTETDNRNRVELAYDRLSDLVSGPDRSVGDRLAPIRTLARQCGTSVPTVQRAMERLEAEGRIERRHGSGVYVASPQRPLRLEQAVALCIEAGADVYGELTGLLSRDLHAAGRFATLVDTGHPGYSSLIRGVSHTDVSCLVIHGHLHFDFELLTDPLFRRKPIIGVLDWEPPAETPPVWQVVVDHAQGAAQMAAHLAALGHRDILFVGTYLQTWFLEQDIDRNNMATHAAAAWRATGGTWRSLASLSGTGVDGTLDEAALLAIMDAPNPPTAIWGLRDPEAVHAQRILRQHRPAIAERTAIVGWYDSVWAAAGSPPITSMNLNLRAIAEATVATIEALTDAPDGAPTCQRIPPILKIRPSSIPALP